MTTAASGSPIRFRDFRNRRPGTADEVLETDLGANDYFAPGVDAVKGYFERFGVAGGVEFVPGFFEQTMAGLAGRSWAMIRLDADGYGATRLALDTLYGGLARGGFVIVDDYFTPGLDVCRDAVDGFRADHGIEDPITRIDWTGARWRKTAGCRGHRGGPRRLGAGHPEDGMVGQRSADPVRPRDDPSV